MRDSDELTDIPPIVPTRDDVQTHRQNRKGQAQEIVRPSYRAVKVKVSTWPVRIMLAVLCAVVLGMGAGAYYFYDAYQADLRNADLRISDLESRLSLVGETAEGSLVNIQEELEFHFSEIDKLWAARNKTNEEVIALQSGIARVAQVNEGQDETTAQMAQELSDADQRLNANNTRLNTLVSEIDELSGSVTAMNEAMAQLESMRSALQSVQTELNSGDSTLLGLAGRVEYVEESMESVNAHRLQINETLFRLQENIESLQRQSGGLQ